MHALMNRATAICLKHNVISQDQEDHFRYGFELLASSGITIISCLALAALVGKAVAALWILATLIPLQSFGGGYHARGSARCYLITLSQMTLSLLLTEALGLKLLYIAVPACVPILLFAPVQHQSAPFSSAFAERMKRIVRILLCAIMIAASALSTILPHAAACMAMGVISSGVSITCAVIQQRRRKEGV